MVRYNRISTKNDSRDVGKNEVGAIPKQEKKLKRRGSHSSSGGSCMSMESNDDDEDYLNEVDDVITQISAERSPLNHNRSYANDGGPIIPSSNLSLSPKQMSLYPTISAVFSGSFDLDDDDDDEYVEAEMKRYHLDFSSTDNGGDSLTTHGNNIPTSTNWFSLSTKFIWFSFQSVRQQARQRRAQLLLQQTERNWRQSLKICIATNCDATDSGILIVLVLMIIWIVTFICIVKNPIIRRRGLFVGIILFVIRVGTRPLYECFLQHRQERQGRQQRLQEFPQNSPGFPPRRRSDVTIEDDGHQQQQQQQHNNHSKGNFELHTIRDNKSNNGNNGTNGANGSINMLKNMVSSTSDDNIRLGIQTSISDPTVAAI
jgi:hypothetical protein